MAINLSIPTRIDFWRGVALFAYRRWCRLSGPDAVKPVGIPGNRDPDAPCTAFAPRHRHPQEWGDCQTDGHYLCAECCHRAPDAEDPEPR